MPTNPVDPKAEVGEKPPVSAAPIPVRELGSVSAPTAEKLLSPTEVVETLSRRGVELKQSIESLQTGNAGRIGALASTEQELKKKLAEHQSKNELLDSQKSGLENALRSGAQEMRDLESIRETLAKQNEENRKVLEKVEKIVKAAEGTVEKEAKDQEKQQKLWKKVETEGQSPEKNSLTSTLKAELEKKRQMLEAEKKKLMDATRKQEELESKIKANEESLNKKREDLDVLRAKIEKFDKERIAFEDEQSAVQREIHKAQSELGAVMQEQSGLQSFLTEVTAHMTSIEGLQAELKNLLGTIGEKSEQPTTYLGRLYASASAAASYVVPERVASAAASVIPAGVASFWASFWSTHEKELTEFWHKNRTAIQEMRNKFAAMNEVLAKIGADSASSAAAPH